jgi:regulator of cell morphogenesis and NO signaling
MDQVVLLTVLFIGKGKQIKRDQNYASLELPFLIDYIVNVHHGYLKENTEQIKAHTKKLRQYKVKAIPSYLKFPLSLTE